MNTDKTESRSRIEEAFREDVIRRPLKVDGPALPGAQERNPAPLERRQGVGGARGRGTLADDDRPRPGPGIEPWRVGGLAAVVGGQHQVNRRVGGRQPGELDRAELVEVAGEQEVPASLLDVEHEAAGVVRGLRVPAGGRVQHREPRPASLPGRGAAIVSHRDALRSDPFQERAGAGILVGGEAGGDDELSDRESVQEVGEGVVVVLIGVTQIDRVDPRRLRGSRGPGR